MFRRSMCCALALTAAACSSEPEEATPTERDPGADVNVGTFQAGKGQASTDDETATDLAIGEPGVVPAAFRGVWDYEGGTCMASSDLRVEIGTERMEFYESVGEVTDVKRVDANTVDITMAMEGEGERWTIDRRFRLSNNGRTLTPLPIESDGEFEPMPLKRCTQ